MTMVLKRIDGVTLEVGSDMKRVLIHIDIVCEATR